MKKILMSTAVAAMLLATSCQNEEIINQQESNLFRLEVQKGGSSRTAIASNGSVTWSKGDKLFVYGENGTYGILTLDDADAGSESGTFTGFVKGNINDLKYVAYGNGVKKVGDKVKVTLGDITLPNSNAPMFATLNPSNLNSVTLQHVCGVVRMNIVGLPENAIVSVVGKGIAGSATFNEATAALVADNTTTEQTIKVTGAKDSYHIDVPLLAGGMVDKVYVNEVECDITDFEVTANKLDASSIPTLNMTGGGVETKPAVENSSDLNNAVGTAGAVVTLKKGNYVFPARNILANNVTIICEEGVVFESLKSMNIKGGKVLYAEFVNEEANGTFIPQSGAGETKQINGHFIGCKFSAYDVFRNASVGSEAIFEDCVFDGVRYAVHIGFGSKKITFKKCVFSGFNAFVNSLELVTFENCIFKGNGKSIYNGANLNSNTCMINCEFIFNGSTQNEWIDCIRSEKSYEITNCTVNGIPYTNTNYTDFDQISSKNHATVKINGVDCQL